MQWKSPKHPNFATNTGEKRSINRVFCIAKNYEEHAVEMGGEIDRKRPFHFQKSFDSICFGPDVRYPSNTESLHYEIELVVILGSGGINMTLDQAELAIYGYAVGIDFTRRDRQNEAKDKGRPWEIAKNFDDSALLGTVTPKSDIGLLEEGSITLDVNGKRRQTGDLNQMAYQTVELIRFLSTLQELKAGDIVYTGTPSGVGSVVRGDLLTGQVDRLCPIEVRII
tara:strand:+ start:520 stop:1194 length:675 start_codon:yes stop_codon:yes gene_type:complete